MDELLKRIMKLLSKNIGLYKSFADMVVQVEPPAWDVLNTAEKISAHSGLLIFMQGNFHIAQ